MGLPVSNVFPYLLSVFRPADKGFLVMIGEDRYGVVQDAMKVSRPDSRMTLTTSDRSLQGVMADIS